MKTLLPTHLMFVFLCLVSRVRMKLAVVPLMKRVIKR